MLGAGAKDAAAREGSRPIRCGVMGPAPTTPASVSTSVRALGLRRAFGSRVVLDGVDLVRETPGIIGLVGPNGSGKTTLLRVIAQLLEADAGTVEIAGRSVERADDAVVRALVGWVPSTPLAWLDDDVTRNLRYAARLAGISRAGAAPLVTSAIARWELESVERQSVRHLSRGWQQRYALARADLLEPPVILLDEPTIGLDTDARARLDVALAQWRSTRVVIVASHEHEWLAQHADELLDLGALG